MKTSFDGLHRGMPGICPVLFSAVLALTPSSLLAAPEPMPQFLDCAARSNAGWMSGTIVANDPSEETGYTIHLDTGSGEWFLSNAGSAALTVGGGDLSILRDGKEYPHQWIGLGDEGATQLRIDTGRPAFAFVFLGHDGSLLAGTCTSPDTPFLFLR